MEEMQRMTPVKAIRAKCMECCCDQPAEVRLSGPQDYWQFRLKDLNCVAVVLYGFDQVDWFLKQIGLYAWTDEIREMITGMVEEGSE